MIQDLIFGFTSLFFFSFLIFNAINWLALWEEKEFNLSRILIHLKETKKGRSLILGFENFLKWLGIISYIITIFWGGDFYYNLFIFLIYLYVFLKLAIKIYNRDFILPTFSLNTFFIIFLSLTLAGFFFVFRPLDRFLWVLVIDRLYLPILIFFTSIFLVFFDFRKDTIINKAIDKLSRHKGLITIAVVGSYAKGSTKEFIARILSIKFNVLENQNAFTGSLGIAKTILTKLSPKKQIFIVEMEDYKPGDIIEMANIARPQIAVITGISDEKSSVFGSLNKIIDSKYEIVETLPRDGIALLNGNSDNTLSLLEKIKNKKFTYAFDDRGKGDILATNIEINKFSLSFEVRVFGKRYKFSNVKLIGIQNVENLLPSVFLGLYLGIDFALIRRELARLRPLSGTMDPAKTVKGIVLINDTYNTHINSIRRAIEYMTLYKGKRILVLEPLTELGKNTYKDHYELGREIGKICDYLFLTNDNYYKPLVTGVEEEKALCIVQALPPSKIAKFIEANTSINDVVVFEGREAYNSFSLIAAEPVLRV